MDMNTTTQHPNAPLQIGQVLCEKYHIESMLGQGGFGITYLARDLRLNRLVVIKEFFPEGLVFRDGYSSQVIINSQKSNQVYFQDWKVRFQREAQTLAEFNHPNIVSVLDWMEANNTAYFVMKHEEGQTLQDYLDKVSLPLDFMMIKFIIDPICDALRNIHEKSMLHLDIKPDNIFLRANSSPMLIDFGGARQFISSHSKNLSQMVFSEGYSPPEQSSTEPDKGAWSDIYALAATCYRCISNIEPVSSMDRLSIMAGGQPDPLIPAITEGRGKYPENFLRIIDEGMRLNKSLRPQSVDAFRQGFIETASPNVSKLPPAVAKSKYKIVPLVIGLLVSVVFVYQKYIDKNPVLKNEDGIKLQPQPQPQPTELQRLEERANNGDSDALMILAEAFNKGDQLLAVDIDIKKGFSYLQRAAEQGNSKAIFDYAKFMGSKYQSNLKQEDYKTALQYFEKAKVQGNQEAENFIRHLKALFEKNTQDIYINAAEYEKKGEYEKAAEYYLEAANRGHAEAQLKMGIYYQNGMGVGVDKKNALDWYDKAANNGNNEAKIRKKMLINEMGQQAYLSIVNSKNNDSKKSQDAHQGVPSPIGFSNKENKNPYQWW